MLATFQVDPLARDVIDEASELMGMDLWDLDTQPASERLFQNALAQPLICAAALAAWRGLSTRVSEPVLCAGYSLGELAAYGCSGALSVAETIELARARAVLMNGCKDACGGMLAVRGLLESQLGTICSRFGGEIAIENGEDHFVIGGSCAALGQIAALAAQEGANTVRMLQVSVSSHTSVMKPAAYEFKKLLRDVDAKAPTFPVIAGVNGAAVISWAAAVDFLADQLSRPIRWSTCMEAAVELGATVFLELGPGASLARMLRECHPELDARSLGDFRSIDGAARWVERALS
jgi:[acyl-carrier-protein] S-malonyltransferase